jgi:hypothetical protein
LKSSFALSAVAQLVQLAQGQLQQTAAVPCGDPNSQYATLENSILCLYFPSLAQKVVFTP